jgi:hypothetical protein
MPKSRYFFSTPQTIDFGTPYGNFIIASEGHYSFWEALKLNNIVPSNSEYEDLPRGRVAYDTATKEYVVYHGPYINSMAGIKGIIKSEFKLKSNTRWEPDTHYQFKKWGLK